MGQSQPFHHRSIAIFAIRKYFTLFDLHNETFLFYCLLMCFDLLHCSASFDVGFCIKLYNKRKNTTKSWKKSYECDALRPTTVSTLEPLTIPLCCCVRNRIRMRCKEISMRELRSFVLNSTMYISILGTILLCSFEKDLHKWHEISVYYEFQAKSNLGFEFYFDFDMCAPW